MGGITARTYSAGCGPMLMRFSLFALNFALFAAANAGQPDDPLKSPECVVALEALRAQEVAAMAAAKPSRPGFASQTQAGEKWEAARRVAAHVCLGASVDAPPPRRADHPPACVLPARVGPSASARPVPAAPDTMPSFQIPQLKTVTSCDLAGCWTSDGLRLPSAGNGLLVGPKGFCTVQGAVLFCP